MKNPLTTLGLVAVIGGLSVTVSRDARAVLPPEFYVFHASICKPDRSDSGHIHYDERGATNIATSGAKRKVTCGISLRSDNYTQGPPTVNSIKVRVYDRRTSEDVSCTANYLTTYDGSPNGANPGILTSATANSSGSSLDSQEIPVSTTPTTAYQLTVRCDVPAVGSGGPSYVTSIIVSVSQPDPPPPPPPNGNLAATFFLSVAASSTPCIEGKLEICDKNLSNCLFLKEDLVGINVADPRNSNYRVCQYDHTWFHVTLSSFPPVGEVKVKAHGTNATTHSSNAVKLVANITVTVDNIFGH
jgi:hypothetical protein